MSELKEDTFYAVIWLERNGEMISVDSRPSDALAIALRLDCPIYVDETVLKNLKDRRRGGRSRQQRGTAPLARESERRGSGPLQDVGRLAEVCCREKRGYKNYALREVPLQERVLF